MYNCSQLGINEELGYRLRSIAEPCKKWTTTIGEIGEYRKVTLNIALPHLRDYYFLKTVGVKESVLEREVLQELSSAMAGSRMGLFFPFLYWDFVCENTVSMLMQPAEKSLGTVVAEHHLDANYWACILYQVTKAVYYLEERRINHNRVNLQTVMFQTFDSGDYEKMAIMLTGFGKVSRGSGFEIGRDLRNFISELLDKGVVPPELNTKLEKLTKKDAPSWMTSGIYLCRWLALSYPMVSERCSLERMDKLYGVGVGATVGDAFGMPLEFDYVNPEIIQKMYPSDAFEGLLSGFDLPPGTFTDDTQMSLALIDAINSEGRALVPSAIAREFKRWAKSGPIDIGIHTTKVLSMVDNTGNNWEEASIKAFKSKPNSAANGATMRVWPIAVLRQFDSFESVIEGAVVQAQVTHMNSDAVYASAFVAGLIYELVNGRDLDEAIERCLEAVEEHISEELYEALSEAHELEYEELEGGRGWIVQTMTVVMWSIRNTESFREVIVSAANVRGDTDTNASIAGAIAGALYGFKEIPKEWLAVLNKNKRNVWHGKQINVKVLKNRIALLSQC